MGKGKVYKQVWLYMCIAIVCWLFFCIGGTEVHATVKKEGTQPGEIVCADSSIPKTLSSASDEDAVYIPTLSDLNKSRRSMKNADKILNPPKKDTSKNSIASEEETSKKDAPKNSVLPGEGTKDNPYQISNYTQLKEFAKIVNSTDESSASSVQTDVCAKLTSDIKCKFDENEIGYDNDWVPIGDENHPYTGIFDGQGYIIKDLSNTNVASQSKYAGVFGFIGPTGQVQNIGVKDAKLSGTSYVGAIAGRNDGIIAKCHNIGNINIKAESKDDSNHTYAGGIAGYSSDSSRILDCYSKGNGYIVSQSEFASANAGGIIGINKGKLAGCCSNGTINVIADAKVCTYAGGVAGQNDGSIMNCYSNTVGYITSLAKTGYSDAGGVVGENTADSKILNCYSSGSGDIFARGFTGNNIQMFYSKAGGIAGYNGGSMSNCYNSKKGSIIVGLDAQKPHISKDKYAGGVVGCNPFTATIQNCYYDKNVCSLNCSIGMLGDTKTVRGLDTKQMTGTIALKNMVGFSSDIWIAKANDEYYFYYPHLQGFNLTSSTEQLRHEKISVFDWPPRITVDMMGDGSTSDPYKIKNYEQLKIFASMVNDPNNIITKENGNAVLENDIICNDAVWNPIGDEKHLYNGTFDGQGHVIIGLNNTNIENKPEYVGLFGYIGSNGQVKNIGMIDTKLSGNIYVGSIAGKNDGNITNCYSTGDKAIISDPISTSTYVGGAVGYNNGMIQRCCSSGSGFIKCNSQAEYMYLAGVIGYNNGNVTNCYSSGSESITVESISINGKSYEKIYQYIGGVIGYNNKNVSNCYSAISGCIVGKVEAFSVCSIGGVIGYHNEGKVERCYYDIDMCELNNAIGNKENTSNIKSLTTQQMTQGTAVIDMFGEVVAPLWRKKSNDHNFWYYPSFNGLPDSALTNVFVISNYLQLKHFANEVNKGNTAVCAIMTEDIDCCKDETWEPIGKNIEFKYVGKFNGNNHTITGLSNAKVKNKPGYAGLFGVVGSYFASEVMEKNMGTIKNVGVINTRLYGKWVGAIAGLNYYGAIQNCYSRNEKGYGIFATTESDEIENASIFLLKSQIAAGGIIGVNALSAIKNCYSIGDVNANIIKDNVEFAFAGGVVGQNMTAVVSNCESKGTGNITVTLAEEKLSVHSFAGGVIGCDLNIELKNTVLYCGSSIKGEIKAQTAAGGVIGYGLNSCIVECYSNVNGKIIVDHASFYASAGGIAGEIYKGHIIRCYSSESDTISAEIENDKCAYAGGIAGKSACLMKDCYSCVNEIVIEAPKAKFAYVGGIIGYNGVCKDDDEVGSFNTMTVKVENCYSAVKKISGISLRLFAGGIIGYNGTFKDGKQDDDGTINFVVKESSVQNCYYDKCVCRHVCQSIGNLVAKNDVKGLVTLGMTGPKAFEQMKSFNPNIWITKPEDEYFYYYPHLKVFQSDKFKDMVDWPPKATRKTTCKIKFVDSDGTLLQESEIKCGLLPECTVALTKENFKQWCPPIERVARNRTYMATYFKDLSKANVQLRLKNPEYDGEKKIPEVIVNGTILAPTDYDVEYTRSGIALSECKDAGSYVVVIKGKGDYIGTVVQKFTIRPKTITDSNVKAELNRYIYGSTAKTLAVSVDNKLLYTDSYDIACTRDGEPVSRFCDAGVYMLTIVGKGNYVGTVKKLITIEPKLLTRCTVELHCDSDTYNGKAKKISVNIGDTWLNENDYDIVYTLQNIEVPECKNAGTYIVTIQGKGNYAEKVNFKLQIKPKMLSKSKIDMILDSDEYNGSVKILTIKTDGNFFKKMILSREAGTYEVTITGEGNYTGEIKKKLTIKPKKLTEENLTVQIKKVNLCGSKTVKVKDPLGNVRMLEEIPAWLGSAEDDVYDGTRKQLLLMVDGRTVLEEGVDFKLDNWSTSTAKFLVDAREFQIHINGIGNYTGIVDMSVTIKPKVLTDENVKLKLDGDDTYNGEVKKLILSVDGIIIDGMFTYLSGYRNEDCSVVYKLTDRRVPFIKNAGTYEVIITGKGNYTGVVKKSVTIQPFRFTEKDVEFSLDRPYYDGDDRTLTCTINGEAVERRILGKDAGEYTVSFTLKDGNFVGSVTSTVKILPIKLSDGGLRIFVPETDYDGKEKIAFVVINGKKIKKIQTHCKDAGNWEIHFDGDHNFTGKLGRTFTIYPHCFDPDDIDVTADSHNADGEVRTLTVRYKCEVLVENKDYTLTYKCNGKPIDECRLVGEYEVTVHGKGNYTGNVVKSFLIMPPVLEGVSDPNIPCKRLENSPPVPCDKLDLSKVKDYFGIPNPDDSTDEKK